MTLRKKPVLVIVTTHFGTNFSGGSTATCEIFSRLQKRFDQVVVVGTKLGDHSFANLRFKPYKNVVDALRILRSFKAKDCVFYGDFYNAYLLVLARRPFVFTYHDNWPEIATLSPSHRRKKWFYWPIYRAIFSRARAVVTVSEFKKKQTQEFSKHVYLVRNGIGNSKSPSKEKSRSNVLMVGNIDERKYLKAVELFNCLPDDPGFFIDIYGHVNDTHLKEELAEFAFVRFLGFKKVIPYQEYHCLLHTSMMENLSIVWCEALNAQTPVLSFDVGGATEVIQPRSGALVKAFEVEEMQSILLSWLNTPSSMPTEMSLSDEYSWDRAAEHYSDIIQETHSYLSW